jgi:hypothetical protein
MTVSLFDVLESPESVIGLPAALEMGVEPTERYVATLVVDWARNANPEVNAAMAACDALGKNTCTAEAREVVFQFVDRVLRNTGLITIIETLVAAYKLLPQEVRALAFAALNTAQDAIAAAKALGSGDVYGTIVAGSKLIMGYYKVQIAVVASVAKAGWAYAGKFASSILSLGKELMPIANTVGKIYNLSADAVKAMATGVGNFIRSIVHLAEDVGEAAVAAANVIFTKILDPAKAFAITFGAIEKGVDALKSFANPAIVGDAAALAANIGKYGIDVSVGVLKSFGNTVGDALKSLSPF